MDCSICLQEIEGPFARAPCGHSFHWECVTPWVQRSGSCPNCRVALSESALEDDLAASAPPIPLSYSMTRSDMISRLIREVGIDSRDESVRDHCNMLFEMFDSGSLSRENTAACVLRIELLERRRLLAKISELESNLLSARTEIEAARSDLHRMRRKAEAYRAAARRERSNSKKGFLASFFDLFKSKNRIGVSR